MAGWRDKQHWSDRQYFFCRPCFPFVSTAHLATAGPINITPRAPCIIILLHLHTIHTKVTGSDSGSDIYVGFFKGYITRGVECRTYACVGVCRCMCVCLCVSLWPRNSKWAVMDQCFSGTGGVQLPDSQTYPTESTVAACPACLGL